jgi:hypothetical protein
MLHACNAHTIATLDQIPGEYIVEIQNYSYIFNIWKTSRDPLTGRALAEKIKNNKIATNKIENKISMLIKY